LTNFQEVGNVYRKDLGAAWFGCGSVRYFRSAQLGADHFLFF
jgi:hypothetical protein